MGKNGVLPRQELAELVRRGIIDAPSLDENQVQPSSIDLRLGDHAVAVKTAFLPSKREPLEKTIDRFKLYDFALSEEKTNLLQKGQTYYIRLQETANLPPGFIGWANPKSTTGRADVMTNLVAEGVPNFDRVLPGESRALYIKVTPLSFNIRVKKGLSLNQLRIGYGESGLDDADLRSVYHANKLLFDYHKKPIGAEQVIVRDGKLELSVDLDSEIVAYRANESSQLELDLTAKRGALFDKRWEFWKAIERSAGKELVLEKDKFYLLATSERMRFPHQLCGILDAYDIESFEGRSHYAGFFDDGFGYGEHGEVEGTPCTLEVRVYNEPFRIEDGQPIGCMRYQRMKAAPVDDSGKIAVYGVGIYQSNYQFQKPGPNLGKQFLEPIKNSQ